MLWWRADGRLAARVDDERQNRAMGGPVRLAVIGYVPVSTTAVPGTMVVVDEQEAACMRLLSTGHRGY